MPFFAVEPLHSVVSLSEQPSPHIVTPDHGPRLVRFTPSPAADARLPPAPAVILVAPQAVIIGHAGLDILA